MVTHIGLDVFLCPRIGIFVASLRILNPGIPSLQEYFALSCFPLILKAISIPANSFCLNLLNIFAASESSYLVHTHPFFGVSLLF
jgi:hypothetical protein